eukprot:6172857-Pleurochrysis_carterae.AAC.1
MQGGAVAWGEPLPQSPSSAPRARAGSGKRKRTPQGARDDVGPDGADAAVADVSDADGAKNDNDKDTEKEADAVAGAVGAVGAVAAVAAVRKPSSLMRGARGFTAKQLAAFSLDEYNRSGRSWTSKQVQTRACACRPLPASRVTPPCSNARRDQHGSSA